MVSLSYLKFSYCGHLVFCSSMPVHLLLRAESCIWKILGIIREDFLLLLTHRVGADHFNLVWELTDWDSVFMWFDLVFLRLWSFRRSNWKPREIFFQILSCIQFTWKKSIKTQILEPYSQGFSFGKIWAQEYAFPTSSQALLILLVWGPYFENHLSRILSEAMPP